MSQSRRAADTSGTSGRKPSSADSNGGGIADDDYCYLTTTGRRTGHPHRIEIWYAMDRATGTLYLLSGAGSTSDWVKNLIATPPVLLELGGKVHAGLARVVDDRDEAGRARALVYEKYAPRSQNDLTGWRRRARPVAIELTT